MAGLLEYKCPSCGGGINFDPNSQTMKCPFCDTEFDAETLKAYKEAMNNRPDQMDWNDKPSQDWTEDEATGLRVYICQSCGGEVITGETTAASSCPFCNNPVVMQGNLSGALRPDLVIPFKLDKETAKRSLREFYKGKRLLPKVFADENHIDEIKGIYVPFWLFSCDSDVDIRYKGTTVRTWSDSRYIYTETSYYLATRSGSIAFDNVPVDGSTAMPDAITESLEPYDYSEAVEFQAAYLSGFFADKYDVDADSSMPRANERVKTSAENAFRSTVTGYTTVIPEYSSVQLRSSEVRYGLLPVWLLNTTWKGQRYTFAMNGQTGKFIGDLPVDRGKYWTYFGLIAAAAAVAAFLITLLF